SLNAEQRQTALITNVAPRDIITGADRKAKALEPMGIAGSSLTQPQQELLSRLLREYVFRCRQEITEPVSKAIEQVDSIHFAWAGGLDPGQGHYYRVQGPTFLME